MYLAGSLTFVPGHGFMESQQSAGRHSLPGVAPQHGFSRRLEAHVPSSHGDRDATETTSLTVLLIETHLHISW